MKRLRGLARGLLSARGGALAIVQTFFAQSAITVINLITGMLTARLLGPVGRGEFAAASLWLLLPSLLAVAGLQSGIVYEGRRAPEQRAAIGFGAGMVGSAAFIAMALISFWCLPTLMNVYPPWVLWLARWAMLASVINVWTIIVRQCLLAEQDYRAYNFLSFGSPLVYLILLVVLAAGGWLTPETAIWSLVLSTVLLLVPALWWLLGAFKGQSIRQRGSLRSLVAYSLRAAPMDLVSIFTQNLDRLVLVALVAPAEFGLYAVAITFARAPIVVLQSAISAVTLADLAGKSREEIERFVHLTFRILVLLLLVGCGAVILVDRSLLWLVYGADFVQAAPIFRVLLLEAAISCLGHVLLQAFLAAGRPAMASGLQITSCAVTAGGVFLLAPMFGAIGAASALALGAMVRLGLLLAALGQIGLRLPRPLPNLEDLTLLRDRLQSV